MRRALIVAHGQPSDPAPAAAALEALAARVAAHLPGWQVAAATLAQPGRLAEAAQGAPGAIFPLFMAGGWFTRVHIPQRLAEAGATGWRMLEPFGCLTAVHDLTVQIARESGAGRVLLAAHGSFKSPVPAAIAAQGAARIAAETVLPPAPALEATPSQTDLTHRDLYARGLTLYEALTGRYPWDTKTPPPGKPAGDPRELPNLGDVAPELVEVLLKAIAPKRADRMA